MQSEPHDVNRQSRPHPGAATLKKLSEWGWRAGFLFCALLSLLFTVPWWCGYRDPSAHPLLADTEREFILDGGARDSDRAQLKDIRVALCVRRNWIMALAFACYGYTINVVVTWMPEFFQRQYGLRLLDSGLHSMIRWGVATVVELLVGGWLVDRLVSRGHDPILVRRAVLTVGLVCGASIGAAGTAESASAAVAWMCLSLSGLAIAAPVAWSLPGLLAAPGTVGAVSGLMNFANTAATGCGVVFTGWLAQTTGSFHAPFLFAVVVLAVGVLLYHCLLRAKPSPRSASRNAPVHRV